MSNPVIDDGFAFWSQHTLGMELDTTDVERFVAYGHNLSFCTSGCHFKAVG